MKIRQLSVLNVFLILVLFLVISMVFGALLFAIPGKKAITLQGLSAALVIYSAIVTLLLIGCIKSNNRAFNFPSVGKYEVVPVSMGGCVMLRPLNKEEQRDPNAEPVLYVFAKGSISVLSWKDGDPIKFDYAEVTGKGPQRRVTLHIDPDQDLE